MTKTTWLSYVVSTLLTSVRPPTNKTKIGVILDKKMPE